MTSSVKPDEIKELSYFEPCSYIQYIERGNKLVLSDSLSFIAIGKAESVLAKHKSTLRLSNKIEWSSQYQKSRVENELGYLVQQINLRKGIEGITLTESIDKMLEKNGQRFGLATVVTGFSRKKGNYGGQVAKGLAMGVLTLGMIIPTPMKANVTIFTFIFDSENNEIAFYKKSKSTEDEPTDSEIIEKKLISLFYGYLYDKN